MSCMLKLEHAHKEQHCKQGAHASPCKGPAQRMSQPVSVDVYMLKYAQQ